MPGAFLPYTEYGGYYVEKRIHADVCRDSGSIAADFRLKDKSSLSWLLEVSSEGWPKYAHLMQEVQCKLHATPIRLPL